jgi:hypothetical protein
VQKPGAIRKEHAKACKEMKKLAQKGIKAGTDGPLESDVPLLHQLDTIKATLEWVHTGLIKTTTKPGDRYHINELMEHRFYAHGPVRAALTWPWR